MNFQSPILEHLEIKIESDSLYTEPKVNKETENCATGKWDDEENLIYAVFIQYYYSVFNNKEKRRYENK